MVIFTLQIRVMTGISRVTTEKAEVKLLNNRILKIVIFSNSTIDIDSAIAITDAGEDISGNNLHSTLIDIRKITFITSEARKHFKNFYKKNIAAVAILIDSSFYKTVMRMYFKLTPPKITTKIFDNEKTARNWLIQKMKEAEIKKFNSDVLF